MLIITKNQMYKHKTECYGCNRKTTNLSGMCDECGGDEPRVISDRTERKAHTVEQALRMIERGG